VLGACGGPRSPFDTNVANDGIARVSLAECSTGTPLDGHVTIVFEPSGQAVTAVVDGGPLAGTPAAACVERVFRTVTIPPFTGTNGTARHSFRMR